MVCFLVFVGSTQVYANIRSFGLPGFAFLLFVTPLVSFLLWFARIRLHERQIAHMDTSGAIDTSMGGGAKPDSITKTVKEKVYVSTDD